MLREEPRLEASYLPAVYSDSMYYKATYDAARRGDWNRVKTPVSYTHLDVYKRQGWRHRP